MVKDCGLVFQIITGPFMHEYTSILQILDLVFANTNLGMSICKYRTFVKYWFEGAFQVKYRVPIHIFFKNFSKVFLPMKFMAKHVSTSTNFSQLRLNCSLFLTLTRILSNA